MDSFGKGDKPDLSFPFVREVREGGFFERDVYTQ